MATFGFVLRALAWVAVLFGGMRLAWVQENLLVPSANLQHGLACALTGASRDAVVVNQSCTGSDAMALCLGAIFAFPAPWRRRLVGAGIGLACILAVNTVRIGSLSLVVADRELFHLLHIYVWPAVIVLVAAVYVYFWMGSAVRQADRAGVGEAAHPDRPAPASGTVPRFLAAAAALVGIYYLLHARWLASSALDAVATAVAGTAAPILAALGLEVTVTGQIVRTAHGAWIVTPECATTPLIPIYLAAVLTVRLSPAWRLLAILATAPLFFALAVSRLLVIALPPALVGSPTDAVHAFYQFLVGAGLVLLTARLAAGRDRWGRRLAAGLAVGAVALAAASWIRPLAGGLWPRLADAAHLGHGLADPQGAMILMPAFQVGLFAALWQAGGRRWRPGPVAGRLLILIGSLIVIAALVGELATHLEMTTPIVLIRAWALAVPPLLAWRRLPLLGRWPEPDGGPRYQGFWDRVGAEFPDLGGAVSTAQYLEGEQRLLGEAFPALEETRLFKTDLWDEARNTRILQWASERGARAHGIDISTPTLLMARREFRRRRQRLGGVVADVRAIPFRDGAFDAAYSMGTVEHFDETEAAVAEIARVVRPGGRAVIGVPNRHDPFLRPLMVAVLYRLGLYGYGLEKSYSRGALREMCERAGFAHVADSGLLFVPGWLRMLDLACWAWARPLSRLTGLAIRPFAWMERRWPSLRRHGYLIAAIVERREGSRKPLGPGGEAS